MKNKMKIGMCSAVLMGGLIGWTLGGSNLVSYASSDAISTQAVQQPVSKLKDVRADHYSYEAIIWAQGKGIIHGYNDGTFKPNDNVTEAQFAKMVSEYFNLKGNGQKLSKTTPNEIWSDDYYNKLAAYGVPMNGYFDNTIRNSVVKRGTVAQTLAYLGGYRMNLKDSINFLLDNKVTVGQNSAHKNDLLKYFGSSNDLSRAQVVAFLYRMDNNGLSEIGTNAKVSFNNDSGYTLNESATIAKKAIDKSLAKGGNVVEKPAEPSKPTTPNKPVVADKNIDSKLLGKFNGILGSQSVKDLESRGYVVENTAKSEYGEKYLAVVVADKPEDFKQLRISDSDTSVTVYYEKTEADIALKLYNYYAAKNNLKHKLTLKQMQNGLGFGNHIEGKIYVGMESENSLSLKILKY